MKALLERWYGANGKEKGQVAHRSSLHPVVKDLEEDWYERPERRAEIMRIFDDVVLQGDVPDNLACTALITNAYLYTGDEKYRQWVLDYTQAWTERTRANGGIVPDNVGPTGKVGEKRSGQWWGGLYGWNSRWAGDHALMGATIAGELSVMLSGGDTGYLEIMRTSVERLLDMAKVRHDGHILIPGRITPEGWTDYRTMHVRDWSHIYHASMEQRDFDIFARLRDGDRENDWNEVRPQSDRRSGDSERARFQYYDGKNPSWPSDILSADYEFAQTQYEFMRSDPRSAAEIARDGKWAPNPVIIKGLVQVTTGTPQTIYNGGLLRSTVRYFDVGGQENRGSFPNPEPQTLNPDSRPGLPEDVAALVDKLGPTTVGIHLVNTSRTETRRLVVQAGAFGEHSFTEVAARKQGEAAAPTQVNGKHFAVTLPPSTSIKIDAGMRRFSNKPTFAFPWHGDSVPTW